MVANITTGNNLYGALFYNQEKVDKGVGTVLATHILREPVDGNFNVADTAEDILRWMPDHFRTEKPVIHISLNPDIKDNLADEQLVEIAGHYMDRMGWGGQPHIVFKHSDIEREHIHIVSVQVGQDGKKIKDSKRNERSVAITEELEKEYGLHPAKGQKRSEKWQLKPVDSAKGDLKRQIAAVIKPALSMYRFQTMGELRALLSFYNIGIEEVRGERDGQAYRGLLYTALDADGGKAEVTPLKSSLFGKSAGFDALERHMEHSGEKITKENSREQTRHRVSEAFLDAPTENALRERLRAYHIDLFIRRNDTGRITGATFIDHENRCVLNGSRLGKEYSANALNERYPEPMKNDGADLHRIKKDHQSKQSSIGSPTDISSSSPSPKREEKIRKNARKM